MTALAVAVGLLALLTLLNLFILLGVIRRLRTMAAASAAGSTETLPELGTRVGEFAVTSTNGTAVGHADVASGQSVVMMLSPGCGPCKSTVDKIAARPEELPDRTFLFVRTDIEDPELPAMLAKVTGLGTVVTFGAADGIEEAFGTNGYPTALRIENGAVAAASFRYAEVLPDRVGA